MSAQYFCHACLDTGRPAETCWYVLQCPMHGRINANYVQNDVQPIPTAPADSRGGMRTLVFRDGILTTDEGPQAPREYPLDRFGGPQPVAERPTFERHADPTDERRRVERWHNGGDAPPTPYRPSPLLAPPKVVLVNGIVQGAEHPPMRRSVDGVPDEP